MIKKLFLEGEELGCGAVALVFIWLGGEAEGEFHKRHRFELSRQGLRSLRVAWMWA